MHNLTNETNIALPAFCTQQYLSVVSNPQNLLFTTQGRPHMKYELDLYDKWREGRAEGIKEGIEQGRKEGIEQGVEKGIEIGEERGIAKGREDGILTVVYTAFEQGLSTEVIASLTHMSIEEIEKLRDTFSV